MLLNLVSILNLHKERTDKLDLVKIVNLFFQSNDNRMLIREIHKRRFIVIFYILYI